MKGLDQYNDHYDTFGHFRYANKKTIYENIK